MSSSHPAHFHFAQNIATNAMPNPLHPSFRQTSINSKANCVEIIKALRVIDVKKAEKELSTAQRLSAGLTATAIALVLIWVVLCVIRFRALRRRLSRLITDVTSALLAAAATVLFAVSSAMSSNSREYNFYKAPKAVLKAGSARPDTVMDLTSFFKKIPHYFQSCVSTHGQTELGIEGEMPTLQKAMDVIATGAPKHESVIHVVAISLCVLSAGLLMVSIVSAILAVCVKAAPEEENDRTWAAPPRVSRQAPGPSYQFFQRFLEPVTAPPEGVFGARENGDCRICLEVLMDDMSKLTACSHTFHTKCVTQWLVEADKPCCPLCKEPVRLVQR